MYITRVADMQPYEFFDFKSEEILEFPGQQYLYNSIFPECGGFNHIKNYFNCKKLTKVRECDFTLNDDLYGKSINIVESFLILESNNNKLKAPRFDTVDEMMETLYGIKPSELKTLKSLSW